VRQFGYLPEEKFYFLLFRLHYLQKRRRF